MEVSEQEFTRVVNSVLHYLGKNGYNYSSHTSRGSSEYDVRLEPNGHIRDGGEAADVINNRTYLYNGQKMGVDIHSIHAGEITLSVVKKNEEESELFGD